MENEKFAIKFGENAFDADGQRANLHGKRAYTRDVADMQKRVEPLDRYDDFRELELSPDKYERQAGCEYGIVPDPTLHHGTVILPHQKAAARLFLRNLRGFGLLSDVVGSGKTYEAGVILSELAVRGKVKSLLLVVPGQVFDNWVDVLENDFGLGKGTLYQVRATADPDDDGFVTLSEVLHTVGVRTAGEFVRPNRPIIVDVDVFARWTHADDLVFDVIVVDEAHHFSEEEGRYARAMQLLSQMMQVKKRAESTYCLLLSATPHSGNLANMFRLWYFIRCKGGNPADFAEKDDRERTPAYVKEKEYYRNYVCRGASNVTEFIRRVTFAEVTERYGDELEAYLAQEGITNYEQKSAYEKSRLASAFLSADGNEALRADVEGRVASAYHNGVLRSIMIRQPNDLPKRKYIQNIFFYPMRKAAEQVRLADLGGAGRTVTVDFTRRNDAGFPAVLDREAEQVFYLDEYIESARGNRPFSQAYGFAVNGMLGALAAAECGESLFTKRGYQQFYADRFREMPPEVCRRSAVVPVAYTEEKLGYKFECLRQLLRENADKRVLLFFDYELPAKEQVCDAVATALLVDKEFCKRILVGSGKGQDRVIDAFHKRDDAVLVVKSAAFTEGANLQACNVIVNYQVTPDPLAMDQRIGRIFRLGQKSDVHIYSLADMHKLEGFALAYFAGIGLLSSNSGDATILAGSNSDQMVAIRCNVCGSNVKLMPREAYEEAKSKGGDDVICEHLGTPYHDEPPAEMREISVYDFACDKCGTVLARAVDDEGYQCVSYNESGIKGKMCNSGVMGDRAIYCRKICALQNCRRFREDERLAGKCPVLNMVAEDRNASESILKALCAACKNTACQSKCKLIEDDVEACSTCQYAQCRPRPHVLDFDDKWEADCPDCRENHRRGGRLKPIVARTFATYIRELWKFEFDGGKGFCDNLGKEAEKVLTVKNVLGKDDTAGGEH